MITALEQIKERYSELYFEKYGRSDTAYIPQAQFVDFDTLAAREWSDRSVFLIQRENQPDLFAVGYESEEVAEEQYLLLAGVDNYLGIFPLECVSTDSFDELRLDREYVRDARGRFAKVAGSGASSVAKTYLKSLRGGSQKDHDAAARELDNSNVDGGAILRAVHSSPKFKNFIHKEYKKHVDPKNAKELTDLEIAYRKSGLSADKNKLAAKLHNLDLDENVYSKVLKSDDFEKLLHSEIERQKPKAKVEPPERITSKTNIAQLKAIADKHGIATPKNAHRRASWHKAIKGHEEGGKYFERKRSLKTEAETEKTKPAFASKKAKSESNLKTATTFKGSQDTATIEKNFKSWTDDHALMNQIINYREDLKRLQELEANPGANSELIKESKKRLGFYDEKKLKSSHYWNADPQKLADSQGIGYSLATDKGNDKLGVFDSKGNLQAAATYNLEKPSNGIEGHLYINYVATAPWNVSNTDKTVKGAGTQAIVEAVKKSKEAGYDGRVRLFPVDTAEKFYEKLGFKLDENDPFGMDWELSPSAARELLRRTGND